MHPIVDIVVYTVIVGVFFICTTLLTFFAGTVVGSYMHDLSCKFVHRPRIYALIVNLNYMVAVSMLFIPIALCIEMINSIAQ